MFIDKSKIRYDRLLELHDKIMNMPEQGRDKFDLNYFITDNSGSGPITPACQVIANMGECGAVYCIGGLTCILYGDGRNYIMEDAAELLGLMYYSGCGGVIARYLFNSATTPNHRQEALERINLILRSESMTEEAFGMLFYSIVDGDQIPDACNETI